MPLYPIKRSENAEDISPREKYKIFQDLCKIYKNLKPKTKLGLLIPPALIPKPLKEIEYGDFKAPNPLCQSFYEEKLFSTK